MISSVSQSIKKFFLIIINLCLCLTTIQCFNQPAPSNFTKHSTFQLIQNIDRLGYSPDQKLLVVIIKDKQDSFFVYNGRTYDNRTQITIVDTEKPNVTPIDFEFSKDGKYLIVETIQSGIYGFDIKNGQIIVPYKYKLNQQLYKKLSLEGISPHNNLIATKNAYGSLQVPCKIVILQIPVTSKIKDQNSSEPLYFIVYKTIEIPSRCFLFCIEWSEIYQNKLLISSGYENSSQSLDSLSIYNLQPQPNRQKIILYTNYEVARFLWQDNLIITCDGTSESKIQIMKYDQSKDNYTFQIQIKEIVNVLGIIKIINPNYIVTANNDGTKYGAIFWKVFYIFKNPDNISDIKYKLIFNVTGYRFALSQSGNQALIVANLSSNKVTRYNLCSLGQYLQETTCYNCTNSCKTCISQTICASCINNKFIYGDLCVDCDYTLSGCLNCSNLSFCLSCNSQNNWKLEPQNGRCICKDGYGLNGSQCLSCDYMLLGCLNCSNLSFCLSCNSQNNWKLEPQNGRCICKDGYAYNSTQCVDCDYTLKGCLKCSNLSYCLSCKQQDNWKLEPQNGLCICKDGYILNGTICQKKSIIQDDNFLYYAIGGSAGFLILIVVSIITIKKCKSRKRQSKLSSLLLQEQNEVQDNIQNIKSRKNNAISQQILQQIQQNSQQIKYKPRDQMRKENIKAGKEESYIYSSNKKSLLEREIENQTDVNVDNIKVKRLDKKHNDFQSFKPTIQNKKESNKSKVKFEPSVVNITTNYNINNVKNPYQIKILQKEQPQSIKEYEVKRESTNIKRLKPQVLQNQRQRQSTGFKQSIVDDAYIQKKFPQNQQQQ